jgi:hypothetical protein
MCWEALYNQRTWGPLTLSSPRLIASTWQQERCSHWMEVTPSSVLSEVEPAISDQFDLVVMGGAALAWLMPSIRACLPKAKPSSWLVTMR